MYLLQDIPYKQLDNEQVNELKWHDLSKVERYVDPDYAYDGDEHEVHHAVSDEVAADGEVLGEFEDQEDNQMESGDGDRKSVV